MTTTKQILANRENAKKGGVKTEEGKAVIRYNALKHGLLVKEAVITVGDGAEDQEEFNALLKDLTSQLNPVGPLEEMLVEKIAVSYWRMRRAYRYETGLIRQELDTATGDYYRDSEYNKTDEEIDKEIQEHKQNISAWIKEKRELSKMFKEGKQLKDIYDWANWEYLQESDTTISNILEEKGNENTLAPGELHELLKSKGWTDAQIWEALINDCDTQVAGFVNEIKKLETDKIKNRLRIEVIKKLGNIPSKDELERLLRYEGTIEKQFYKALNHLERVQRQRKGDIVPAPATVDVNVNSE